jgi:hypothetical protein
VYNEGVVAKTTQGAPMVRRAGFFAFAIALAMPVAAMATGTQQGLQMMRHWVSSDRCMQAAQKAFPDYTADSIAKREAQIKQCLANQNLPPREAIVPGKP